jgi:hypothetical protein
VRRVGSCSGQDVRFHAEIYLAVGTLARQASLSLAAGPRTDLTFRGLTSIRRGCDR